MGLSFVLDRFATPIKNGLMYSIERGQIAFSVPHFGRYLRTQA